MPGATAKTSPLARLLHSQAELDMSRIQVPFPAVLIELESLLRSHQRATAQVRMNQQALQVIDASIRTDPTRTDIMFVAAKLLAEMEQYAAAERLLRMILDKETHAEVLAALMRVIRQDPARTSEALPYAQQAYELDPDKPEYLHAYLRCVRDIGDVKECVRLLEQAIALAPEHCGLEFQLLWNINYLPGYDRAYLFERAKQWGQRHVGGLSDAVAHSNPQSLTRALKVGIVSADFKENSAMTFYEPALAAINRETFTLYAYSNVETPTEGTERFKVLLDVFRDIHEISDFELASQIRCDGIDILIVFGGQCLGNRMGVVAHEPAPIQVDWGALCSLGLPQIGYRLTDKLFDPPDTQRYHLEELVYLSPGYVTYRPPPDSPPVTALPARSNGHITFGSFNNHLKINDQVLDMWALILLQVPDARMVLKFPQAHDPGTRRFMAQRFKAHGIDPRRIRFWGRNDYAEHLRCLGQVDLLLDTFPFNGHRTTLEGIWMGVPTITLAGTTSVSRAGLAVMKRLGLDTAFVARSPRAYVDRACAYARHWDELARLRSTLRDRLLASSICDSQGFARNLEEAFRYIWKQYCAKQDQGVTAPEDVSASAQADDRELLGQAALARGSYLRTLTQDAGHLKCSLGREKNPEAWAHMAKTVQRDPGRVSRARTYWQRASELAPDNMAYVQAYASSVRDAGDVEKCMEIIERGMARAPQAGDLEFQWLQHANYLPGYERVYLSQRAKQWCAQHMARIPGFTQYHSFPPLSGRLKLGLVSGDFYENSPMACYEPALGALNRDAFALYAYSNVQTPDVGTARFATLFDTFRDIHQISDQDMAAQVHQDGIDILIAFGGHCQGNRLRVLAYQPAPIQVDWGALAGLGFPQIDYRITDEVVDPPDMQRHHLEEIVYLSGGVPRFCPPAESPPVAPLPAQSKGYMTFGSFNHHVKINDQVLGMWTQILQRIPDARLALKFSGADDPGVRKRLKQKFQSHGIALDRIQFFGTSPHFDHLRLLGQVDLLLDCYPFNGYRTALEGLWMGVPTLTLSGTTQVSRRGLAILKQLGLDGAFAAQNTQAYIDRACSYAEQLEDLACIRAALRDLLLSSPICDTKRYTRSLEEAFRYMWRQHCKAQQQGRTVATQNADERGCVRG